MRILVQVWCEIDPTLNVRIDRQTTLPAVDAWDQLLRVSPLGRAGVAAGKRLGEVTAFALGAGHDAALRHALAGGATRAVELDRGDARALAGWVQAQAADLVIADRLAGNVAAQLGWSHLAGLDDLHMVGGVLKAVRCLERGDREIVSARLPAAIRLQADDVRPPYVARARLQAVAGCDIEQVSISGAVESTTPAPLQLLRPRTKQGAQPRAATSAHSRLQALMSGAASVPSARTADEPSRTVEEMAEEFVRYLLHHDLLP
ncbi:MAG: hypothetical protein FJ271_24000 [Planctomycetes bacterium]|nr:hypothetical protein [Planctomycetota bacterium]